MSKEVLSTRALNRALLARQLLLERFRGSVTASLERVAGLQTQYAPSAYVALWSRLEGFRRDALTKALYQRRAVQATLMRSTIHIVSARDFPLFAAAIRRRRQEWWTTVQRRQLEGVDMDDVARRARKFLANGPKHRRDLEAFIRAEGFPRIAAASVGMWLDLVRVPPSGTWEQRRADLYGLADEWIRGSNATEAESQEHLIKRYLGGFGPASLSDIASWAGLSTTIVRAVADRLRLRRFRDEHGGELLDLQRAPLPDPETPAPVRFLPTWDATLLVHARRTQILPERYRNLVFNTRTPHSISTFLVDGAVAGTWRYDEGRVRLEPFDPIPRWGRRDLDTEASRLAAFHSD
ncbi:MAG TPA: winged helix DNA-binding domain-containing protein [Actinomycetota bacterium]|nr:winged helix DNA-binding domain-containing protein [Actinomycetota bacterium]